jgi:hypothetical protein
MKSGLVSCIVYYLNLVATVGQPLALTLLEKAKRTSACFFLSSGTCQITHQELFGTCSAIAWLLT